MSDDALFAELRAMWREADPVPDTLVDRMIAAVASDGLTQEYALLTLIDDQLGAVRGDADALTLQFSDGSTSILLHITTSENGRRRVDGWVDTAAGEIVLTQGDRSRSTTPAETGRFAFDDVPPGLTSVRLTTVVSGETRTLSTPRFEL
ncbi:hypothetical protein [uncultured Microbacterium sp.]|uniref:hypothetical protein n=1 Tax=uncultured Microbacterium sp. TaxID=191216 RepID=UPI0028DC6224|nr:hypothetical protein [uncultured Microbacterium sp.]